MSRKEKLPPELTAFEAELSSLRPDAGSLDMGRLMFLAGQESAAKRPRSWTTFVWPTAFTAMTGTAVMLLVMLVNRPQPEVVERIVRIEVPVQQTTPQASPTTLPENGPGNETPAYAVETIIATAPDRKLNKNSPTNPKSALGMLASVFFKQNRLSNKIASDRHQLSYRELREQILAEGMESWPVTRRPVSKSGRTQRKNTDPISRHDWTKALLAGEG